MADSVEKIVSVKIEATQAVNGIIALNKALDENRAQMQKAAEASGKNSKEYIALAEKSKALSSQKRTLQKETQNEIKMQSQEEGSLKALRAELSKLTNQFDSLSRAERENGKQGKQLQKQINQVTTEIKAAEEGTQRYYRNVGNYQNAIMSAMGLNNRYVQSLMLISSNATGANGAIGAMTQSVMAFGKALLGLLSNPVFLAIAGIAGTGMAIKWFVDYNNAIAEANRLTREFTGYTGDELVALRNSIQATADVMDKDFKETLQTVDALMAHFHLTGEEAMDIINKGFAAGADVNGDMLQKVQQLAPAFRNAGIEADQMMALIAQTRSGIFSDKGLDAIAMGTSRIRQMSDNMQKALQGIGIDAQKMAAMLRDGEMSPFGALTAISEQLQTLSPNTQEYGKVMNEVFGKAGKQISTEMVQGLADMSTSLDEVKDRTGEYGDLLLENIKTEQELDNVTSALFDMSNKGWEEIKQKATIFAKKALVEVIKRLVDVVNWFVELYNKSLYVRMGVQYIIAAFKSMWEAVKFVFNLAINAAQSLGRAFSAVADIIEGAFSFDASRVMKGIDAMNNAIKQGWNKLVTDAKNAGKGIFTALGDAAVDAINDRLEKVSIPALVSGGGGKKTTTNLNNQNDTITSPTSSSKGGKKGSSKSTPKADAKKEAKKERDEELERQKKLYQDLQKQAEALEKKALDEQAKLSIEGIDAKYKAQEEAIRAAYSNLNKLTEDEQRKANEIMQKLIAENNAERAKEIQAYYTKQAEEQAKVDAYWAEQAKQLVDASLEASTEGTDIWLKWRLEQLRMAMEAELQMVGSNSELRNAIIAKYEKQATDIYAENAQKQMEIQQTKYEAIASVTGGLSQMIGEFADDSKEAAIASKVLALGEIMVSQAVAIANAVKAGSNATNPWQMIAQIAASVTAVTVAMIQAFKSLDSAKFATGGYVRGAGTGTSDSIPVRVSNGESIMNANTTAMFGGLLSSLNQLGGGVPIQVSQTAKSVAGEDMLARAVAKGVAMLPAPVVSVQDINRGQRQVEVLNERALL